jgi:hypothetical protein
MRVQQTPPSPTPAKIQFPISKMITMLGGRAKAGIARSMPTIAVSRKGRSGLWGRTVPNLSSEGTGFEREMDMNFHENKGLDSGRKT